MSVLICTPLAPGKICQMATVLNSLRQWKHSTLVGFMHKDSLVKFRHKINTGLVWLTVTASIMLRDARHVLMTTITTENISHRIQIPVSCRIDLCFIDPGSSFW